MRERPFHEEIYNEQLGIAPSEGNLDRWEGYKEINKIPYRHWTCHPFLNVDIGKGLSREIYLFIPHDKSRNTEVHLRPTQKIIQLIRTASFIEGSPKSFYSSNNRRGWIPQVHRFFSQLFPMLLGTRNWWSREIEKQKNIKFQRCEVIKGVKDEKVWNRNRKDLPKEERKESPTIKHWLRCAVSLKAIWKAALLEESMGARRE